MSASRISPQHVQTAMVPITPEQVAEGWREIQRQEEIQHQLLEVEARRKQEQQVQKQQNAASTDKAPTHQNATPPRPGVQKKQSLKAKQQHPPTGTPSTPAAPPSTKLPTPPVKLPGSLPSPPPTPDPDDDEPDRL